MTAPCAYSRRLTAEGYRPRTHVAQSTSASLERTSGGGDTLAAILAASGCICAVLVCVVVFIVRVEWKKRARAQAELTRQSELANEAEARALAQAPEPLYRSNDESKVGLPLPKVLHRVDTWRWSTTRPGAATCDDSTGHGSVHGSMNGSMHGSHHGSKSFALSRLSSSQHGSNSFAVAALQGSHHGSNSFVHGVELPSQLQREPSQQSIGPKVSRDDDTGALKKRPVECVICFEGKGDHVLLPCGHGGYCGACAHTLLANTPPKRLCPLCRDPLGAVVKVHSGTAVGAEGDVLQAEVAAHPIAAVQPKIAS